MLDDINIRIKRIYSAIDALEETDFDSFEPTVIRDGNSIRIGQNFRGDLSEEELSNLAHSMIHNIANLYHNLKKWAAQNHVKVSEVDKVFNSSHEIKIIQDLSNNDKHGYPPRNGGHSGISPKIEKFTRGFQLTSVSQEGFDSSGKPKMVGKGMAVVISGEISDAKGQIIGNLHLIAKKALDACRIINSVRALHSRRSRVS